MAGDARVDWRELMAFKRSFTDPVPANNEARYADKGIDAFRGQARFTGRSSLEIEGVGVLRSKHFLIASGAEPVSSASLENRTSSTTKAFLRCRACPRGLPWSEAATSRPSSPTSPRWRALR